jgi:GNAT superfamily N-acetyltransferase
MMDLVATFLKLASSAQALVPGAVDVATLDLDRDWPDLERLLLSEDWPFLRSDLEVGDAQPRSASLVARKNEVFAGFFTTHHFGDVGYLDMMIIAPDFRGKTVARPLYLEALSRLRANGIRGLVVHTTNDSARLIQLMGFKAGQDFTLLVRPAGPAPRGPEISPVTDRAAIVALDAEVFGAPRERWIEALLAQPSVTFVGRDAATTCLRPRVGGALCLDAVNSRDDASLVAMVDGTVGHYGPHHELQCFVRTGSLLHQRLVALGFEVPAFFVPIGPLVEWRQGATGAVGTKERVQSLMWL